MTAYDVCVFGSGPAGAATALRLADLGASVYVLDRPSTEKVWGGESFHGAIRHPLSRLDLWNAFCAAGHVASYEQHVTWGGEPWTKESIYSLYGNLWHVDRGRFDADLRQAMQARSIPVSSYRDLDSVHRDGATWYIQADARTITARYLVDATGRARAIARRLGAKTVVHDRLVGLAAQTPRNQKPEYAHAMILEATPHGWWYAAPVPSGHVIAFFTDADLAPRHLARSMRTVTANSAFTDSGSETGWIAVGDACAAHDPLCGWGVARALSNGILAAAAISSGSLEPYREHCRDQFQQYLTGLATRYASEQRWADAPFWKRRTPSPAYLS